MLVPSETWRLVPFSASQPFSAHVFVFSFTFRLGRFEMSQESLDSCRTRGTGRDSNESVRKKRHDMNLSFNPGTPEFFWGIKISFLPFVSCVFQIKRFFLSKFGVWNATDTWKYLRKASFQARSPWNFVLQRLTTPQGKQWLLIQVYIDYRFVSLSRYKQNQIYLNDRMYMSNTNML